MIEGAAILLVGLVAGYFAGRRGRRTPALPTTEAMCSCRHPRGQHLEGKDACQAKTKESANGIQMFVPCACQLYDGPEPLPQFYAPEIQP